MVVVVWQSVWYGSHGSSPARGGQGHGQSAEHPWESSYHFHPPPYFGSHWKSHPVAQSGGGVVVVVVVVAQRGSGVVVVEVVEPGPQQSGGEPASRLQ